MLEDIRVIALVRSGEADSFSDIIERYQPAIFRYIYRLTGNYETSRDLAQDTFVQAYQGILKTEIRTSFKAWLYRIATNNVLQLHRRKKILSFIPLREGMRPGVEGEVEERIPLVEKQMEVQETLSKLPPEQRVCLVLHYVEGFKYREIAAALGISEEAVRKRVARGSREFKRLFSSEEVR